MAEFSIETAIKSGVEKALKKPIVDGKSITEWAAIGMKAPRWISVKDRLPMQIETVLFIGKNYHGGWFSAKRGYFDGAFWYSEDSGTVYSTTPVTHWMPLPEPPEEVSGT